MVEDIKAILARCLPRGIPLDPLPVCSDSHLISLVALSLVHSFLLFRSLISRSIRVFHMLLVEFIILTAVNFRSRDISFHLVVLQFSPYLVFFFAVTCLPFHFQLAVQNALRYFPSQYHALLAPEFAKELLHDGHIYMRRFRPREYAMKAYPLDFYPAKCRKAACIMLMIMNNLDPAVWMPAFALHEEKRARVTLPLMISIGTRSAD